MAAKRVIDQPYGTYSVYTVEKSGIDVKCPRCGKRGVVTADHDGARFSCGSCGKSLTKEAGYYRYDIHNQCESCGRYYRASITDEDGQRYPALHVACPRCGHSMQGKVHKTRTGSWPIDDRIHHGCEPWFGLELWFLDYFDGKPMWALNREHLAYLIDYLEADLREKPVAAYPVMRTQADQLPTFMKAAKNRERIVKLFKRMQQG